MTEIAQIFTEFFRDLDVVPSDVIAGLVLLRRYQKLRMVNTIEQETNDIYQYLSGIPITPRTEFLQLGQPEVLAQYKQVIHYMRFALAAYGWPIYMMMNTGTGLCKMLPHFSCCCYCRCCCPQREQNYVIEDNCCECNSVALKKVSGLSDAELVYITYHVDIGETPFYVALDTKYKKIVVSVRGTLSLQDVLTDLKADAETIPTQPLREDWVGHKGMVQAAIYIRKKLKEDQLLEKAFEKAKSTSSENYDIVLVGHSLGAGTAAILAILLQPEYPGLHCYAYSPPGGLLSLNCVEETRHFITSVVLGKDVVPRIGLPQMELLRTDLINIIKKSKNPKWKIILKALCCGSESAAHFTYGEVKDDMARNVTAHPSDEQIGLSAHKPLFPPGKIILVVRNHPEEKGSCCQSSEPVYQAVWADNSDFQEVLISPTMVNDHMPDNVMEGLEKVLVNVAPPEPMRLMSEQESKALLVHDISPNSVGVPEFPDKTIPNSDFLVNNLKMETVRSISWDMSTIEDKFITLERLESDEQQSYPSKNIQPHSELDLMTSDWFQAPLASPETLSEVSSLGNSSRSSSVKDSIQKAAELVTIKLETIQQSPEMCANAKQVESVDASNYSYSAREVSIDVLNKCDVANIGQLFDDTIVSGVNHVKNSAIQPESSLVNKIDNGSVGSESSSSVILFPPQEAVIEDKSYHYDTYDRHSPDHCTQYGYGNPNEHYSAAGIGYPHGFGAYHPPVKHQYPSIIAHSRSESKLPHKPLLNSQSDSHLQTLLHKYQMKRSTEQRDIAHLQDSTYVFEAGALHTIKTLPEIDDTANENEEVEENNRSNMPQSYSISSHADSSDYRLSSQSDEIMDCPIGEMDV
ncbi:hypothetical protein CHS0354_021556 [Potamilus streckersoni]|nr:hypothetical protein CHS0354_021556 [Potamilus streckersoni]